MFKTENCPDLGCTIYYKSLQKVSKISIRNNKIHNLYNSTSKKALIRIFTNHVNENVRKPILEFIHKNNHLNDIDIYSGIRIILKTSDVSEDTKRGEYRINTLNKVVTNWNEIKPTFYLDIGCYQGDITKTMGSHFNLNKFQIHGIDIKQYIETNDFIYTVYDGVNIPYNDNSFDLITCFMVLHHIPPNNLEKLLSEVFRVMKPNGILILREHNAEPKDYYLLDVLHEYYDYVLNEKNTWEESSNYYNNIDFWTEKLLMAGFECDSIPKIKKNNPNNPFNNYVASFKKPEAEKSIQEFFRILTPDFPREIYQRRFKDKRNYIHWGQRKLLLSEIEFLVIALQDLYNGLCQNPKNLIVIYAGAAPGTHIHILQDMFPTLKFILYDPAPFSDSFKNIGPGSETNIEIHQEYFTNDICHNIKKRYPTDSNTILFVSDIRTADIATMTPEEVEQHILADQNMQLEWYNILEPDYSMFKFRLPWTDGITRYLNGDIYFQAYAPLSSTETRLIVKKGVEMFNYDNRKYEEQLFYFNKYMRDALYEIKTSSSIETMNYDQAAEYYILLQYNDLCLLYDEFSEKNIQHFSEEISSKLSDSRTLYSEQPLSYTKKELVKKLISHGLVPSTIKFTIKDYNLYVLPIANKIIELGL